MEFKNKIQKIKNMLQVIKFRKIKNIYFISMLVLFACSMLN